MDIATARRLIELNTRFYREHASSFSATRQAPWEGWGRCLAVALEAWDAKGGPLDAPGRGQAPSAGPHAQGLCASEQPECPKASCGPRQPESRSPAQPTQLSVLDLACGNLRFERFLTEALPGTSLSADAVDNCAPLVEDAPQPAGVRFHELDLAGALLNETLAPRVAGRPDPLAPLGLAPCDLAVCFGFLHHVPGIEARAALMRALVGQLRPGGVAIVSLWRFLDDARLARKAAASHPRALADLGLADEALDEGDRLLGWQEAPGAWRYCHHFPAAEVDALADATCAATGARELARFDADGASGHLNRYLVLQAPA